MIPTQISDHEAQAKALLTDQFRNKTKIVQFLATWTNQVQALETVFADILTKRFVETAVGDQLDQIGKLVNEDRNGNDDDTYRIYVRLKILANKSQGLSENLLEIASQVPGIGPFTYDEPGAPATWEFDVFASTDIIITALFRFLHSAKAGGTLGRLVYSTWALSRNFQHSSVSGGTSSALPFASVSGGTAPSVYVAIEEL